MPAIAAGQTWSNCGAGSKEHEVTIPRPLMTRAECLLKGKCIAIYSVIPGVSITRCREANASSRSALIFLVGGKHFPARLPFYPFLILNLKYCGKIDYSHSISARAIWRGITVP